MGRRIEIELTSEREDGVWTWRAAGAKQPKGDLNGGLLYSGASIGDVVKADASFHLDGIEITEVFPPKKKEERTDLIEMKSRPLREDELVTTQRVSRGGRDRSDRNRDGRRGRGRDDRSGGRGGENRRSEPRTPDRPKPKRLKPGRAHRNALLESVAEEYRPIIEQLIRDGMPGVRSAIEKQNAEAKAAGKPEIDASPILAIAEENVGKARLAEWRDRADAALAGSEDLDLRDLRSVVVVGTDIARDDESRAIADQLKTVLDERMESDHAAWLADMRDAVAQGRTVRALRLSSRPVKAGAPLPTELATELAAQTSRSLAPDTTPDRWAIVLDAVAFSPVRAAVAPVGIPETPSDDLIKEVRRLSDRLPTIAGMFGIDPASVPKSERRRRSGSRGKGGKPAKGGRGDSKPSKSDKPKADQTKADKPKADKPKAEEATNQAAPVVEAEKPEAETPAAEAPEAEKPEAETPAAEAPEAEAPEAEASSDQNEPEGDKAAD